MRPALASIPILAVAPLMATAAPPVHAQSGGAYSLEWNSLGGGGQTFATGGAYTLGGTTGQADAGSHTGGAYALTGGFWWSGAVSTTGVDPQDDAAPRVFAARIAGANPFRHGTALQFDLPRARHARVAVYGVDGRLVRVLLDATRNAGRHTAFWDGAAADGRAASPGMYFARVSAGDSQSTLRLVRVR